MRGFQLPNVSVFQFSIFPFLLTPEPEPKGENAMKLDLLNRVLSAAVAVVLLGFASYSAAQDKPANNLEIIHEKLKADKKLIVTKYMELTESEAKKFWRVYEVSRDEWQE
jgi:hypothetical protein